MATYTDQQIRDYVNNNFGDLSGTELHRAVADAANKFGVSSSQLGRAFDYSTAEVDNYARKAGRTIDRNLTTGSQISDPNIRRYVQDLQDTGMSGDELGRAVYSAAKKYGIDENQYANAMGLSVDEIRGWIQDQGLGALSNVGPAEALQSAIRGTYEGMSYNPQQVEATNYDPAQVASTDLSAYMNPYTQEVIDRSLSDLERARQGNINNLGFAATQAGAFGGSRHGVAEALTNEGFANQAGNMAAGLRQQGFNTALGQAQYDVGAQNRALEFGAQQGMNAQQLNQNAGLQGAQLNLNAANQMGQLGNLGFTQQRTLNQDMFNQGLAQQQMNQNIINNAMQQYQAWQGWPSNNLGLLGDSLGGTTAPTTTTTSPTYSNADYLGMVGNLFNTLFPR